MTKGQPPRHPFARARRLLLAGLGLTGIALLSLYWLGRSGPLAPVPETRNEDLSGASAISEGFEYTQVLEGRPVFRLRGDRFRSGQDEKVQIEGVELTLFRADEEYQVASSRAIYDSARREAVLEGDVRLAGGRGLSLSTSSLELVDMGRRLRSHAAVTFASPSGHGRADSLDANLDHGTFALSGGVALEGSSQGGETISVQAQSLVYDRRERQVRATGGTKLSVARHRIEADEVVLFLTADERTPELLRASGSVRGDLAPDAGDDPEAPAPASFHDASALSVRFEPGAATPNKLEIEGTHGQAAVLISRSSEGPVRVMTSRLVVCDLVGGKLASMESVGGADLKEYASENDGTVLRYAAGGFMRAEIDPAGKLQSVTITGEVDLAEPRVRARAARAVLTPIDGRAELFGEPVVLTSERGELRAPRVSYVSAGGKVHAEGNVEATLRNVQLPAAPPIVTEPAAPPSAPKEPVRVRSSEAFLDLDGRSFVFRGDVRAYQGASVLFAEQLRGEDGNGRISASGAVRTIWRREQAAPPKPGEVSTASEPVEVTAATLTYEEHERKVRYEGGVQVRQGQRQLSAGRLEADLDEQQRARSMTARQAVTLLDPLSGRSVAGDSAIYDLVNRIVTIAGEPARLKDRDGNVLTGRQLVYDLEKGGLRAGGPTP